MERDKAVRVLNCRHASKSRHSNDGQRIVHGCRMMQPAFLGWTEGDSHGSWGSPFVSIMPAPRPPSVGKVASVFHPPPTTLLFLHSFRARYDSADREAAGDGTTQESSR